MCRLGPALDVEERPEGYHRLMILPVSFLACFALHASTSTGQTVGAMTGAVNGTVTDRDQRGSAPCHHRDLQCRAHGHANNRKQMQRGSIGFRHLGPAIHACVHAERIQCGQARRDLCRPWLHCDRRCRTADRHTSGKCDCRAQLASDRQTVDSDRRHLRFPPARRPAQRPKHVGHSGRDARRVRGALRSRWQRRRTWRPDQRIRNGWLQSADGRGHQRDRHQSDRLYPGLRRVPRGLSEHGCTRPWSGICRACTCSSSANREGTSIAARSMGTLATETGSPSTSTKDRSDRGAQGGRGLSPRDANRLWSYHDINADVGGYIKPDAAWRYVSVRAQEVSARQVNFPVKPVRTSSGKLRRQGYLPDNPAQQAGCVRADWSEPSAEPPGSFRPDRFRRRPGDRY